MYRKKLTAGNFVKNNGALLTTINILRHKYNKLSGVQSVLEARGIEEDEFLDSVNFLAEESYIKTRTISDKISVDIADIDYKLVEAKLSAKGIRLLAGGIQDNMIEV